MRARPITARRVAALCAAAFVALSVAVATGGPLPGEVGLLRWITDAASTRFDGAARVIGDLTDPPPLIIVSVGVVAALARRRRWADIGRFVACVGVTLIVNPWLKDLVDQPRPTVRTIPEPVSPLAFPAGHAANTAGLLCGLLLVARAGRPRRLVLGFGLAGLALVAWSRLVVGAHHPSDLVAGWLWVTAIGLLLADVGRAPDRPVRS